MKAASVSATAAASDGTWQQKANAPKLLLLLMQLRTVPTVMVFSKTRGGAG
jgi:hypothetical protein